MSAPGENCASACRTKDHRSFGQCLRGFSVLGEPTRIQNEWDKELSDYERLRKQGVNPGSTFRKGLDHAERVSQELGRPYDAEARVIIEG